MKKSIKVCLFSLLMALICLNILFSGGTRDNALTGTWYGGSTFPDHQGYKYQYTFTPTAPGKYMVIADGAYGPASFGAGLQTKWTGTAVKLTEGGYEIRLISMITGEPVEPPDELPMVLAVMGKITIPGSGKAELSYYWYGMYQWGKKPFVDVPATWFLYEDSPPIDEILDKMESANTPPAPPKM